MGAVAIFLYAIIKTISLLFTKIIIPLIPFTMIVSIVIMIICVCIIISGVGGSLLFYVILFFYVKALLNYNPVLEAREQAAQMQQVSN